MIARNGYVNYSKRILFRTDGNMLIAHSRYLASVGPLVELPRDLRIVNIYIRQFQLPKERPDPPFGSHLSDTLAPTVYKLAIRSNATTNSKPWHLSSTIPAPESSTLQVCRR
jgi:hypothetical protein